MKYKVRNFYLHRESVDGEGIKSYQTYEPGAIVELTPTEGEKYKHLVELVTEGAKK